MPILLGAQKKANWETQFYFEDALGNKDTITLGYDTDANSDYNPDFGEVNIKAVPWDSIFEARASHLEGANDHASPNVLSKKIIGSSKGRLDSEIDCSFNREALQFFVKVKHLPLKISWNQDVFNNDCISQSYITPHHLPLIIPDWFRDTLGIYNTNAFFCLGEYSEYVIQNFSEVDNSFFPYILEPKTDGKPDTIHGFLVLALPIEEAYFTPCPERVNTEDLNENNLKINVHPNPTTSSVRIDLQGAFSWRLYNVQGIGLLTGKEHEINIEALPGGMYFVEINTGKHIVTKRIVKSE